MQCIAKLTQLSWNLITTAYCSFEIDDVYFQALCLQVQVDMGGELMHQIVPMETY